MRLRQPPWPHKPVLRLLFSRPVRLRQGRQTSLLIFSNASSKRRGQAHRNDKHRPALLRRRLPVRHLAFLPHLDLHLLAVNHRPRRLRSCPPSYRVGRKSYARLQEGIAAKATAQAQKYSAAGLDPKASIDQANNAHGRAQQVREFLAKDAQERLSSQLRSGEPTGPMKEAQQAGVQNTIELDRQKTQAAELTKEQIARSNKTFTGITGSATEATKALDNTEKARALLNNPSFTSGYGAHGIMTIEGLKSWAGGNPDRLASMQAFTKVTAANLLGQISGIRSDITQETGGASGRVFSSEIDMMKDASASLDNSPEANRILVTIQDRLAKQSLAIQDEAIKWRKSHGGILTDDWYSHIGDYLDKHRMFTDAEMANPARLMRAIEPPKAIRDFAGRNAGMGKNG